MVTSQANAQALLLGQQAWQLQQSGQFSAASALYQQALALAPMNCEILWKYARLGNLAGDYQLALRLCDRMLRVAPNHRPALMETAFAYATKGDFNQAIAWFHRVEQHPDTPRHPANDIAQLQSNIGACYKHLYDHAHALPYYERAVELNPNEPEYVGTLGTTLYQVGQDVRALSQLRRAVMLGLKRPEILVELGCLLLRNHQWQEGWSRYRHRIDITTQNMARRPYTFPHWDGSPLQGKLLLTAEQGQGDMILFATMLPDFLARQPSVILEVPGRLLPLMRRSFPSVEMVPSEDVEAIRARTDIAAALPLGDIGAIVRSRADAFPAHQAAILKAEPGLTEALRTRYRELFPGKRIVGISWSSKAAPQNFPGQRSVSLLSWGPILQTPDVAFINLQYGDCRAELKAAMDAFGIDIFNDPEIDALVDMDAFAAQVAAMDQVITIDNTTVHVAAGLGIPTSLLTPATLGLSWFWGREGETCPWYPALRLYRSETPGEWSAAIQQVHHALEQR